MGRPARGPHACARAALGDQLPAPPHCPCRALPPAPVRASVSPHPRGRGQRALLSPWPCCRQELPPARPPPRLAPGSRRPSCSLSCSSATCRHASLSLSLSPRDLFCAVCLLVSTSVPTGPPTHLSAHAACLSSAGRPQVSRGLASVLLCSTWGSCTGFPCETQAGRHGAGPRCSHADSGCARLAVCVGLAWASLAPGPQVQPRLLPAGRAPLPRAPRASCRSQLPLACPRCAW